MNQEEKQILADFLTCFEGDSGERAIEELEKKFGKFTSFVPGDPYATAFKEGSREVVLYIKRMLAKARDPQREGIKVKT